MKKVILFLSFGMCVLSSRAQNSNIQTQMSTTTTNWTTLLQNLNTAQITSGVLYDRVTPFANLVSYNRSGTNISDYEHFIQSIDELYRASNQTKFLSAQSLKNQLQTNTSQSTVEVGIINTAFQFLNYNETTPSSGGLTYANGVLYPIAGKPSFLTKKIFLASPLKTVISGASAVFKFSNGLLFQNATSNLKKLVVNFGVGSPVTIVNNGTLVVPSRTVNYSTKGVKMITFLATFQDNTTMTTYASIYFNYKSANQPVIQEQLPCYESLKDKGVYNTAVQNGLSLPPSTFAYKGDEENSPVNGKIEYTIFYHNNNGNTQKKIIKPIIIIDGFDPEDKRKVLDCDCENDPVCFMQNKDVTATWNGLYLTGITFSFNPNKHRSIEDMMYYNDILPNGDVTDENLIKKLRDLGYDVIIINNPSYTTTNQAGQSVGIDGGADYIERNGMNMVSYLMYVKKLLQANGSTEKIVVVGPSMGGQISRYALAYMDKKFAETNNDVWKHNTRLWISVDSPHLGANIPMGTQASVYWLGYPLGQDKAKNLYNKTLNSIAARQQLLLQYNQAENDSPYNTLFTNYYNNQNTNGVAGSGGYPVSNNGFRKIALINGSLDGTKTNVGNDIAYEGRKYLYVRGYIDLSWWFFNWNVTGFRINNWFMPGYGGSNEIFSGEMGLFQTGLDVTANNFGNIHGSYDVIPGGMLDSQKDLKNEITEGLSGKGLRSEVGDYFENHSFIPSFSALGHLQPNQNWGNPLNFNLKCPSNNLTPFDSYFGESKNTTHTTFNKESVAWLLKELAGNPQAPYFPLQAGLLTGPDVVCDTNVTYSFADVCKVPSPVTTWSVSSNLNIVSSTSYSVIVNKIEDGEGFIKATFQNGQTTTKTIWAGYPQLQEIQLLGNSSQQLCIAPADNLTTSVDGSVRAIYKGMTSQEINLASNWQWQSIDPCVALFGSKNTRSVCPISICTTTIRVRAKNSCGWSDWYDYPIEVFEKPNQNLRQSQTNKFSVFPNPSNDIVTVDLRNQNNLPEKGATISGELFDMMGQSKAKIQIIQNKASFSVRGLNKGIYVLKIYINHQVETHQIAVQ